MAWKKSKTIAVVFLLSSGAAFAETTYLYVVKNNLVSKISDVIDKGSVDTSQPLFGTQVQVAAPGATTYILVQITPKDQASKDYLQSLEQSGAITRVSQDDISGEYVRGEYVVTRTHKDTAARPADLTKVYSSSVAVDQKDVSDAPVQP